MKFISPLLAFSLLTTPGYSQQSVPPKASPFEFDLKALPADDGWVGLDYRIDVSFDDKDRKQGSRWSGFFKSQGFLTADQDRNDIDALSAELGFNFDPLWRVQGNTIPDAPQVTPDNIDSFSTADFRESAAISESPLSVYLQGHGKFESTQDFGTYNVAFGSSLAVTTSYLQPLLDFPFKWFHDRNNNPRQLDLAIGYDYLVSQTRESGRDLGSNRLAFAAEYETGIGCADRLRFTLASYYDLDGRGANGRDLHPFLEVRYMHLLAEIKDAKVAFAVKWTTGELPPNYERGHILGAGFSIEF